MVTGPGDEALVVEGVLLRVVLLGIGIGLAALGIVAIATEPSLWSGIAALVVAATTGGVLLTRDPRLLRLLEIPLFIGAAALLVSAFNDRATEAAAVSAWRDATLATAVLGFAYAALVPNSLTRAAVGMLALTSSPGVLLGVWAQWRPPLFDAVVAHGIAESAVLLVVAAVVGVAAHALLTALLSLTVRTRERDMYQLLDKIGAGGMGEIWRARHRRLSRTAAVKLIRPDLCADPDSARDAICRFEIEAKATARLRSPNTVEVYDFGTTENGAFYYVMEHLDGLDLRQLIAETGPLPAERVLHFVTQVCLSLSDAHEQGLIHRDIKPANIFISRLGTTHDHVKVLDFGLVRPIEQETDSSLSRPELVLGTPGYIAPEAVTGTQDLTPGVDIYALGCVAYFALTARPVFPGNTAMAVAIAHVNDTPVPPSQCTANHVPADLEAVVMRCLEKTPEARFDSCDALLAALRRCEDAGKWSPDHARAWWQGRGDQAAA